MEAYQNNSSDQAVSFLLLEFCSEVVGDPNPVPGAAMSRLLLALSLLLTVAACDDGGAAIPGPSKSDERFAIAISANPKTDGPAELLSASDTQRLVQTFDNAIAAGELTVASLEVEIARLEATSATKAQEIASLVQQIAARRADLARQYDNNMILCMFFPNPATCVFANYLANDGTMRSYETQLGQARAAQAEANTQMSAYSARRNALRDRLVPIRASKARLVALVRSGVEVGETPAVLAQMPALSPAASIAYSRITALQQVSSATASEIAILVQIRNAAAELSAALDGTIGTLRGLLTSVDALVRQERDRFMDLLAAALGGDPAAAVDRWLEDEIAALTRRALDGLGWPRAEFVEHLFASHPAVAGVDVADVLAALGDAANDDAEPDDGEPTEPDEGEATDEVVVRSSDALGIYDNTEAVSMVRVTDTFEAASAEIEVHIEHTWRGDLRVWLEREGVAPIVLHDRTGGQDDDLDLFLRIALEPVAANGDWRLHVADEVALDEGRLVSWTLTLRTAAP